jgi:hypothetical protein
MTGLQITSRVALLLAVWPILATLMYRYAPDHWADKPGAVGASFVIALPFVLLGFALLFWW